MPMHSGLSTIIRDRNPLGRCARPEALTVHLPPRHPVERNYQVPDWLPETEFSTARGLARSEGPRRVALGPETRCAANPSKVNTTCGVFSSAPSGRPATNAPKNAVHRCMQRQASNSHDHKKFVVP